MPIRRTSLAFARTTNGGASWEPARKIYKAGTISQTIGNVIAVLPDNATFDGELVDVFTLLHETRNDQDTRGFSIAAIRSADHGATWTKKEVVIDDFLYEELGSSGSALFPFFTMPHGTDPASIFSRRVAP